MTENVHTPEKEIACIKEQIRHVREQISQIKSHRMSSTAQLNSLQIERNDFVHRIH